MRIEPILKAKAKERQGARNDLRNIPPNSAECSNVTKETRNELAKIAGVGHDTIERVSRIFYEQAGKTPVFSMMS